MSPEVDDYQSKQSVLKNTDKLNVQVKKQTSDLTQRFSKKKHGLQRNSFLSNINNSKNEHKLKFEKLEKLDDESTTVQRAVKHPDGKLNQDKPVTVYDFVEDHPCHQFTGNRPMTLLHNRKPSETNQQQKETPRVRSDKPATKPLHLGMMGFLLINI